MPAEHAPTEATSRPFPAHIAVDTHVQTSLNAAKDKAVKRFTIKDIVDPSSKRDIKAKIVFTEFEIPKIYLKQQYCISCAIHSRVVRVRSAEDRKIREPPKRVQRDANGNIIKATK
jgi:small subunit ribosomal protein S26e